MSNETKGKKVAWKKADKEQTKAVSDEPTDRQFHDPDPNRSDDSEDEFFDKDSTAATSAATETTASQARSRSRSGHRRCRRKRLRASSAAGAKRRRRTVGGPKTKKKLESATETTASSSSSGRSTSPAASASSGTDDVTPASMSRFRDWIRSIFTTAGHDAPIPAPSPLTALTVSTRSPGFIQGSGSLPSIVPIK